MEKHKKVIAFFLSLLMVLSTIVVPENTKKVHAVSGDDFDVNSAWTLSEDITSEHTARETLD